MASPCAHHGSEWPTPTLSTQATMVHCAALVAATKRRKKLRKKNCAVAARRVDMGLEATGGGAAREDAGRLGAGLGTLPVVRSRRGSAAGVAFGACSEYDGAVVA